VTLPAMRFCAALLALLACFAAKSAAQVPPCEVIGSDHRNGGLPCAFGDCIFSIDKENHLSRTGECPTQTGILWLNRRAIMTIDEDAFAGMSMTLVRLESNAIDWLPKRLFSNVTRLETLFLGWNNLEILPRDLFRNTTSLNYLILTGNKLQWLPDDIFSTTRLVELDLYDNEALKCVPLQQEQFAALRHYRGPQNLCPPDETCKANLETCGKEEELAEKRHAKRRKKRLKKLKAKAKEDYAEEYSEIDNWDSLGVGAPHMAHIPSERVEL
jgi:hypothetical protein